MKQYFGKIIFWLGTAAEAAVIQYYLFGDFGCIGIILAGLTSLLLWGLLLTLPRGIIITTLTVQALFFWLLLVWHSHFDDPLSLRLIATSYREGLQFAAVSWQALLTLPVAVMLTFTCGQLIYILKFWRPWADRLMLRLVCGIPVVCHDTVLILKDRKQIAVYDSFAISRILTQRKQAAVVLINGIRIIFLTFQIDLCVIAVYLQPWSAGCKTCIRGSIPLERSPGIITADTVYRLQGSVWCQTGI